MLCWSRILSTQPALHPASRSLLCGFAHRHVGEEMDHSRPSDSDGVKIARNDEVEK